MGSTMKIVMGLIGVMIAFIMFPMIMDSTHQIRTDPQLDTFDGCVVAAEETDVVLTEDLYQGGIAYVTEITATGAGAVPVADSYVAGTNTLTVAGLGAETPQDLTVTYDYGAVGAYTGLDQLAAIAPLVLFVGLLAAAGLSVWSGVRGRG